MTMRYAHLAPNALSAALSALEGTPIGVRHPVAEKITAEGGNLMELGTPKTVASA